jgi:hypothetical protein
MNMDSDAMTWPTGFKIVSGGQTGADRAALDFAIAHGIPHDGWCPKGRRAEDGVIIAKYLLHETPARGYATRTEWNIRDSDGTVIFSLSERLSGGSLKTLALTVRLRKPHLHLSPASEDRSPELLERWMRQNNIRVLNVAGPRASEESGVAEFVHRVLTAALISPK